MMYAIEFEATVKNGMIKVPRRYASRLRTRLRVIVLQEEPSRVSDPRMRKEVFLANVARHRFELPKDYTFKREELYDRI